MNFDLEKAKAFRNSDEYAPLISMRQSAAYTERVFMDGII
jgi:uncharacterized protein (DUF1330 family)